MALNHAKSRSITQRWRPNRCLDSMPRRAMRAVMPPARHTRRPGRIRVELPSPLRALAHVDGEVTLDVAGAVTLRSVLDALEAAYPVLRGTIRDQASKERRAFLRFFACGQDLSHQSVDVPLPGVVASGTEPVLVVGAIAGG